MSVQEVRRRQTGREGGPVDGDEFTHLPTPVSPHALPILVAKGDHEFELDEEALKQVLLSDEVREKKVVVLSIAGAFRKGKSFMLDFFLRYLQRNPEKEDWLGDMNDRLVGFPWRSGTKRETTGILLWSKPFIITSPSTGEDVAVLLMDTQGAFDNRSTVKDSAIVFALSTMIASVQIYNLSQLIQENDLQHLQLFTEYGRLALEEGSAGVFQSLCFLVRDWNCPYEHAYGLVGGLGYLEEVLQTSDDQHEELKQVRKHINTCFKSATCFLMPYPGSRVATSSTFDGRLADIDEEFQENVRELTPMFLAPENLVVKEINGTPVTGRGLLECFRAYMKVFHGDNLPEPKGMLQATAEANNLAALASAMDEYNHRMEDVVGGEKPYLSEDQLNEKHEALRDAALNNFRSIKKMGGEVYSKQFEEKLLEQIEEAFEHYQAQNASKNIFAAARTPAVLFALMVCFYVVSGFCDLLGIEILSWLMNWCLGVAILTLVVWAYVRFSGQYREIGQHIDTFVSTIWEQAVAPLYRFAVNQGVQTAAKYAVKKTN